MEEIELIHKIEKEVNAETETAKLLVALSVKGMLKKYDNSNLPLEKLCHELSIMIKMDVVDYILIVQDFLDIARCAGHMPDDRFEYLKEHMYEMNIQDMKAYIMLDQTYPGMTVGPGRGSAAGSVVTFALGITAIEPISNGLLFERFLNPERVSMPDIDSDLSKSEYNYGTRDIAIEYCAKKYGRDALAGITVPSTLAVKAAVKSVARILGDRERINRNLDDKKYNDDPAVKQINRFYLDLADSINALVPKDPNASFDMKIDDSTTLYQQMKSNFTDDKLTQEVIDDAYNLESININFGKHACGVIISDNGDISDYVPLMHDPTTDGWKVQVNAEQAEEMGLLKMDFLGLKNLNVITKTVRMVYENSAHQIYLEPLDFPQDPKIYSEVFSSGRTQSVFQFESPGMKKMLKRFQPETFSDLVLLVACYRPGPMQYLDGIINRKHGLKADENAVTRIASYNKAFNEIVAPTYMALVYQEQIMQTFRTLAGYSMGGADNVRRAMGHKKMSILVAEKQNFVYGNQERNIVGAIANGIKEQDALDLFEEMIDFAKYSFNKSHAAAYAETAYITAYLKYYHKAEYYAAVLDCEDLKKYPALITEARSFGVVVKGPDINNSQNTFIGKNNTIYFGFSGIKGVQKEIVKGPYTSFANYILESSAEKSINVKLINSGAFDCFCNNRAALLNVLPLYMDDKEKIDKKQKDISLFETMIADIDNGIPLDRNKYNIKTKSIPDKKKLQDKISKNKEDIETLKQDILSINIPVTRYFEDLGQKLDNEQTLLGMYVSGNPIDIYGNPEDFGAIYISDIDEDATSSFRIIGMIKDLRLTKTKKDPTKKLAFFNLEDQSGTIPVCCFTDAYNKYSGKLSENAAISVYGYAKRGKEDELQFVIDSKLPESVAFLKKKKYDLICEVNGIEEIPQLQSALTNYADNSGHKVYVHDLTTGEIDALEQRVSDAAVVCPDYKIVRKREI